MFFRLVFQSFSHKILSWVLHAGLVCISCSVVITFILLRQEFEQQAIASSSRINLVLAAKGSPLQVLASTLYFIEPPTGNLPSDFVEKKLSHPLLEKVIPISLGDNHKGFNIVGTTTDFMSLFHAVLKEGFFWREPMQAVVGAWVPLGLGTVFEGGHSQEHHHEHFQVVGRLAPTGTVLDRLILTDTASYWLLHPKSKRGSITAYYLRFKGSKAATILPSFFSKYPDIEVVSPLVELTTLMQKLDWLKGFVFALSMFIMGGAGFAILVSLLNNLRYEMPSYAFLRLCGASRTFVAAVLLLETLLSSVLGFLAASIFSRLIFALAIKGFVGIWPLQFWVSATEIMLLGAVIIVSVMAALIPIVRVYRKPLAMLLG